MHRPPTGCIFELKTHFRRRCCNDLTGSHNAIDTSVSNRFTNGNDPKSEDLAGEIWQSVS